MISQWMNAARNPSAKSIKKIAKTLNIPFDYFIEKSEDNNIDDITDIKKQLTVILNKISCLEAEIKLFKSRK